MQSSAVGYVILLLSLLILVSGFVSAYWNTLTIFLLAFSLWMLSAQQAKNLLSLQDANKYAFWFSAIMAVGNMVAMVCLHCGRVHFQNWLKTQGFEPIPTFMVWVVSSFVATVLFIAVAVLISCTTTAVLT